MYIHTYSFHVVLFSAVAPKGRQLVVLVKKSISCKEEHFLQKKRCGGVGGGVPSNSGGWWPEDGIMNIYYEGSRMLKYYSWRVSRTGSHAQLPPRAKHIARSVHYYGSGMISAILRGRGLSGTPRNQQNQSRALPMSGRHGRPVLACGPLTVACPATTRMLRTPSPTAWTLRTPSPCLRTPPSGTPCHCAGAAATVWALLS